MKINLLQLMHCKIVAQCITIHRAGSHFYTFKDFKDTVDSFIE